MSREAGLRPDGRTLGSELRTARLGFRWMADVGGYVRLADLDEDSFRVDVAPPRGPDLVRGRLRGAPALFRCWWERGALEDGEFEGLVRRICAGEGRMVRPRRHLAFVIGMDGEFLRWCA